MARFDAESHDGTPGTTPADGEPSDLGVTYLEVDVRLVADDRAGLGEQSDRAFAVAGG
jgi:hypothetical protein